MASDLEKHMALASGVLPEFDDAWRSAFKKYLQTAAELRAEWDDTTAANVIRAHMLHEIRARFQHRRGFNLLRVGGLHLLLQGNDLVWRFKRVDAAGRHSNVQTLQQRRFDWRLPLPGLPAPAVRLTSGYQTDPSGEIIERIIVARPYGRSVEWAAQVNVVESKARWVEITPRRFAGTSRFDKKKGGKGGR